MAYPRAYDEAMLDALEKALHDVWQVGNAQDRQTKTVLAEKLMALADAGIIDPQELTSRMLHSLRGSPY